MRTDLEHPRRVYIHFMTHCYLGSVLAENNPEEPANQQVIFGNRSISGALTEAAFSIGYNEEEEWLKNS